MSLENRVEQALVKHASEMTVEPDVAALVARGMQARRRRLAIVSALIAVVVIGALAAVPMLRNTAAPAPVAALPSPTVPSEPAIRPVKGTSYFLGSEPNAYVSLTVPTGWNVTGVWVYKTGGDPETAVAFIDVANIYLDGCRWELVDPEPGPSVDDLVAAYAKVPGAQPATDVIIDGFEGKQIRVIVPTYEPRNCKVNRFGLMQHDNEPGLGDVPSFVREAPGGAYRVVILDVRGSRLVIYADDSPNASPQDRADLDAIVASVDFP